MNTSVELCGVTLKNPVMTASGTFGSGAEYSEFTDLNRLGAVVTKGVANVPWPGNPTPRVAEVYGGMLNAVGLQNPGVDAVIAHELPELKKVLVDKRREAGLVPVELRLDSRAAAIIDGTPAGGRDFDTEFLDYIMAVGIVDDVRAAAEHIACHSTAHSEAIVAEDKAVQETFASLVDSAAVYINASTRFTDGGEFGLGCEMGISTQKLHARGPMGLRELTSYKYIIRGDGNIR